MRSFLIITKRMGILADQLWSQQQPESHESTPHECDVVVYGGGDVLLGVETPPFSLSSSIEC